MAALPAPQRPGHGGGSAGRPAALGPTRPRRRCLGPLTRVARAGADARARPRGRKRRKGKGKKEDGEVEGDDDDDDAVF